MAAVLHPLVLTNMCDHYDRVRRLDAEAAAGGGGAAAAAGASEHVHVPGAPVCGLLFGLQTAQKVDICTSIEAHVLATAAAGMGEDPANAGGAEALPWALNAPLIARWVKLCACAAAPLAFARVPPCCSHRPPPCTPFPT
jgi:hypothetical protein